MIAFGAAPPAVAGLPTEGLPASQTRQTCKENRNPTPTEGLSDGKVARRVRRPAVIIPTGSETRAERERAFSQASGLKATLSCSRSLRRCRIKSLTINSHASSSYRQG